MTNDFEINIIELPKAIEQAKKEKNQKEKRKLLAWLSFLKNPDEMGDKEMEKIEEVKMAKEELEKIRQDKEERKAYLREKYIREMNSAKGYGYDCGMEEGILKGIEKGLAEGLEKGMEEGIAKGIEKGLAEGLDQGKLKEKREIAKKLLEQKIDIEIISSTTGLSIDIIKSL